MSRKSGVTGALVMLPGAMVEEITQYKLDNDIRTRNDAIRALIKKGLEDSQE
ncbi:hypothetical protein [Ammoniphilus oxalaticus]|uniref:hypothetical protein n=1 Tax=Ammoniphilus oxalaticus TaxID=66863 RepID=UPI001473426E|nr:hypothetical protein [Ammoniphilus oxalaticus]